MSTAQAIARTLGWVVKKMPYTTIRASFTVPSEHASEAHEIIDQAIDQLVIRNIPVADSDISQECADPPEEIEELTAAMGG